MRRFLLTSLLIIASATVCSAQSDIDAVLQMLADFTPYIYKQYEPIEAKNSKGETIATFRGENTFGNNEQGVRHNADLSMVCAFLCKYAKGKVALPSSVTWEKLDEMARTTLTYSYSTHKALRFYPCKGNSYWGSVSTADHTWESSLWAMSVAYSAFFQWDSLSQQQRQYIHDLLAAECTYELQREVPTGYEGDTKAEENGWECGVLAATLGLFPDDPQAKQWFGRLREFAINSFSHPSDKRNRQIIDLHYDSTTVADLYRGPNLYADYTLQNHNYFHTSYQNVVVQELGEAALALSLFQTSLHGSEQWLTHSLMHNVSTVMKEVLYHLALSDGELAMPNGNDWSLFLYDQITSFTTAACFLTDPDALMLEQKALRQIAIRQKTTTDGSWLLRPDVGARRMGVEAHRVMMTWLMHHAFPTRNLQASSWSDFLSRYSVTAHFSCQDVVTAPSPHRFTCFSWSKGLKSYTGYFAPVSDTDNNIVVPFRANNTGNFIGWYDVEGKKTDAVDVEHEISYVNNNSYIIRGTLHTNQATLQNNYLLFATDNNLVLYFDLVTALDTCVITQEKGGLLAISTDPFTKTRRTLSHDGGTATVDGEQFSTFTSNWMNIDDCLGIIVRTDKATNTMAFGDRKDNNSVLTSKLYSSYSDIRKKVNAGATVDARCIAYYSNVSTGGTQMLNSKMHPVSHLPKGWKGWTIADTDGTQYAIVYNHTGKNLSKLNLIKLKKAVKPNLILVVTIQEGKFTVTAVPGFDIVDPLDDDDTFYNTW